MGQSGSGKGEGMVSRGFSLASRMFLATTLVALLILGLFLWMILGTLSVTATGLELRSQLALANQEAGRLANARDAAKDELEGLARGLSNPRASSVRPLFLRLIADRPWLTAVWLENADGQVLLAEPNGPIPRATAAKPVVSFRVGSGGERLFAALSLPSLAVASLPRQSGWILVSDRRQVLWTSSPLQGLDLRHPPFSQVVGGGHSRSFPTGGQAGMAAVAAYVPLPQSQVGLLDLHQDGLISTVQALRRQLLVAGVVAVLAAVPLFLLLARRLSRPLRNLGESLRQLEAGVTPDLSASTGILEVDWVQGALERLSSALTERHRELRQAVLAVGKAMAARSGREEALRHLLGTTLLLTHSEQGAVLLLGPQDQVDTLLCAHRDAELTGPCDLDPATIALLGRARPEATVQTLKGRHSLALPVGGEGAQAAMLLVKADGASPFTPYERDMATLMGETIHTALSNQSTFEAALRAAETDTITGLYNFRYFMHELERALLRYERTGTIFSIILLDLDYFKTINDRYGHLVGDGVLRGIGETLGHVLRGSDILARYGGEEFVVLLPGTHLADAASIAERIRQAIEEQGWEERVGVSIQATASLGVAAPTTRLLTPESLLAAADHAMYVAKREGRNRVRVSEPEGG